MFTLLQFDAFEEQVWADRIGHPLAYVFIAIKKFRIDIENGMSITDDLRKYLNANFQGYQEIHRSK